MESIPIEISNAMEQQPGDIRRADPAGAMEELDSLGVLDSQMRAFLYAYRMPMVSGGATLEELMDPSEPSRDMRRVTEFARDVWKLPARHVVLTSCEGEGCFALDFSTGEVVEFSLRGSSTGESRRVRWSSFYEFLAWFLGRS